MSAIIASAAIGAVGAGYKIYQGISQNSAANKLQKGLVRPMYKIQDQYYQNQGLAENRAQNGLDENSRNYYNDQANRGLSSGISGILQGGGNVNSIGSLYDKFNQGNRAISTEDSQFKNDNIRYLIDRNKDLAGQETQQWAINKYEPYKDTATAIAGLRGAGSQNISGGLGEIGSIGSTLAGSVGDPAGLRHPDASRVIDTSTVSTPGIAPAGTPIVSPTQTFGGSNPFGTVGGMKVADNNINTGAINTLATNNTLKNYQSSPYYDQLSAYLNQAVA